MNQSSYILEVNESNFARDVIERSHEVPVVVDFWAEWCAPCRALGPVLERLAEESQGSFVLAKVDTDRNPNLASAAGVQGIPAVRAFKDGREIDEFTGAIPEPQVRAWLRKFVPDRAQEIAEEGIEAESRKDFKAAEGAFRKSLEMDPTNETSLAGLRRLDIVSSSDTDDSPFVERLEQDPNDLEAATSLARIRMARGEDHFYNHLIRIIETNEGDTREAARLELLDIINLLPPGDYRSALARKELTRILF